MWILFLNNANQVYCSYLGQQLCRQTFSHLEEPKETKNCLKEQYRWGVKIKTGKQLTCINTNGKWTGCLTHRELKQQRRRRPRKRHLKSEFALLQTLSRLLYLVHFVKCWQFFLEMNSKRLHQSSGKEIETRSLVFTSSEKREIRQFHVVVVHWRQRNVQKSVMHVQSCCFANLNQLRFCSSLWRCPSSLLKGEHSVAMLGQCCNYSKQCCNAVLRLKSSLRIVWSKITVDSGSVYMKVGDPK